jgi:phosphatidylglycerol:prolipoprotein diacylglycerol transferase
MGIHININPVLFTFGSFEVRWYGVMMAVGVAVLIGWAFMQVRRGAKLTYDNLLGAAIVGIPAGIIFSRLLHVVDGSENINYYFSQPSRIIGGEGLTIYGAILGAALGVWVYSRFNKINFAYLTDIITPGIILAQVLGRVGCTINGCCYGTTATNLPWAIIYTQPNSFGPIGEPTQPTVVYEILFLLALFAVIMIFRSKFKPAGVQFLFYLGMYSVWRIGIGVLRAGLVNFIDWHVFGFHIALEEAQFIGIVTAIICFSLIAYRVRKAKSTPDDIVATAEAKLGGET